MKSLRIISLLFWFFCVESYAKDPISIGTPLHDRTTQIDSIYNSYSQTKLSEKNALRVLHWYQEKIDNHIELTNDDLEKLAVSYAFLKNGDKASIYIAKYVKKSHDTSIFSNPIFKRIEGSLSYKQVRKKYRAELNPWILFFLSTGLIGIFIAIVLNLRKKGDTVANLLISVFVLIHSLFMIHLCLFLSKFSFSYPHSLYITTSFSFLYGPLLYFYFKRISERYTFKLTDLVHLLPSVFLFLYLLPIYIMPTEEKLHLLFNRDEVLHSTLIAVVVLKCISLLIYGYLVYRLYMKNVNIRSNPYYQIMTWQKNIITFNSVYILSYVIYGVALMSIVMNNYLIYPQILAMAIIVLYVGYTAYVQPRVFSKKHLFNEQFLKYKKSGLNEGFSIDLKEQLLNLFNQEKIYKMNNISLDILSERIGTTRHNISQVINEHFDLNFFNLINKYRIKEAQQIFKHDLNHNLNIIDVAYDVGFNNKVTFNKAFKEETNLTPSQYIQNLKLRSYATM